MVRKSKVEIKPLVAKPLEEKGNSKRGLVSSFVTNNVTENVTKKAPKKAAIIKKVVIGKTEITAKFESDEKSRPNYILSKETIEKIEKVSELLGYKKAEFLDIYLNGNLTKILNKLEKENNK